METLLGLSIIAKPFRSSAYWLWSISTQGLLNLSFLNTIRYVLNHSLLILIRDVFDHSLLCLTRDVLGHSFLFLARNVLGHNLLLPSTKWFKPNFTPHTYSSNVTKERI